MDKFNLENICEKLQVPERRSKMSAFDELQKYCENPKTSQTQIIEAFDECYLYLLKCYSDRYESIRDQAAHTVSQFLERMPPNDFHVSNIMSTLFDRMGGDETIEESEEIRLMYVQQLHSLIALYPQGIDGIMHECQDFLRQILRKAIRDAHPAVQREACACIVSLFNRANRCMLFQKLADILVKPLYGVLNHKHSMVRISAIQALSQLALHVDCSGDTLSRLIMEVSPLLMDSMPLVRRECGKMGVILLLELHDRYSYFDRIIPLVLCCLKDESPEVVSYITPLWNKCGKQYYDENEEELSKQEIGDIPAENYPEGVMRPWIGCRALVQRSLRLLTLITRESADWKNNVRLHSLRLLYQFVLHAEAAITAKFFEIYPDIARACRDCEHTVSMEALKVSDLMGRLMSYNDWFEHGFEGLSKSAREGYLKCFWAMFNGTASCVLEDLIKVSNVLVQSDYSQSLKPGIQMYVIELAEVLLSKSEKAKLKEEGDGDSAKDDQYLLEELFRNLYVMTVKVLALSQSTDCGKYDDFLDKANTILQNLAQRLCLSVEGLHEKYFGFALEYVQNLDVPLDGLSEPILLLNGLINIAKFRGPYIDELQNKITTVWENCSAEAKINVFTVISMEMLHWSETMNREIDESVVILKRFLEGVAKPHLKWNAGASAESMRSLAVATLCAASQGAPKEVRQILPGYASFIPSLLEDHAANTRYYTIKCIPNFGEVPLDELKPIAYAILQRLDDPASEIRVLAATSITRLQPKFQKPKDEDGDHEHEVWNTFLKKALDMLFIHYDGPDMKLKDFIRGTIMEFAYDHPGIVADCFKKIHEQNVHISNNLKELERELPKFTLGD